MMNEGYSYQSNKYREVRSLFDDFKELLESVDEMLQFLQRNATAEHLEAVSILMRLIWYMKDELERYEYSYLSGWMDDAGYWASEIKLKEQKRKKKIR